MVLKCLNHIYRLSTDVMFFTWSPFVWMKINWWQMRKDSAKTGWGDLLDRSAPKWTFWATKQVSKSQCGKAHTPPGALRGSDISYRDEWNKMISGKLSGIATKKEVTVTHHEGGSLGSPLQLFLAGADSAGRHHHTSHSSSSLSSLT